MQKSFVIIAIGLLALVAANEQDETAREKFQRAAQNVINNNRAAGRVRAAPAVADADLQAATQKMYELDLQGNASPPKNRQINTRSTNGKLFLDAAGTLAKVQDKPTYKAFIALLDNYEPALGTAEAVNPQEVAEQNAFLDEILKTPVLQKAFDYLKSKGKVTTPASFKALLNKIWFTIYRRRGQPDTSGFEHAFVGEIEGPEATSAVTGFHNWIRLAQQEAAGKSQYIKYSGYGNPVADLVGMKFKWLGREKIKSTIAIGESPEMSIAINTICFLMAPNAECKVKLGGDVVSIQTYAWDNRYPAEQYVASAYYN
ncbi:putative Poly(U)-specific endoribonuclease-D [Hypsibius exemplaris]|uniref:Uridylate-specific endoribonuclease n=1 Tax=Hypsibius exemplaris TaxID=2072580 RepID=A0A1W0WMR2_HYPEX|nr:putative Poly(U)-specific endoribonuclease-D [Hypsibius exemplaris]